MKLDSRYDLICYGDSLSSYLLAALAARIGVSVLHISNQHTSNLSEDLNFVSYFSMHNSEIVEEIFKKLGKSFEFVKFEKQDSIIQTLFNRQRVTFFNETSKTLNEIAREIPEDYKEFAKFFENLDKVDVSKNNYVMKGLTEQQASVADLKKFKKLFSNKSNQKNDSLNSLFLDGKVHLVPQFAMALFGAFSDCVPYSLGIEQLKRTLPLFLQNRYVCNLKIKELKNSLAKMIRVHGGDLRTGVEIKLILTESKKITGVHLDTHEGVILTNALALGTHHKRIYKTLDSNETDIGMIRSLNRIEPKLWKYSVQFKFNKKNLPTGLESFAVKINDNESNFIEDNFVIFNIVEMGEIVTLIASVLLPYTASSLNYHYLQSISKKILGVVDEVMPFVSENLMSVYPDFRNGIDEIQKVYPFNISEWVPEDLIRYHVHGSKDAQDFSGLPWQTSIDNLYFIGKVNWPSFGIYGEILSAYKVFSKLYDIRFAMQKPTEVDQVQESGLI